MDLNPDQVQTLRAYLTAHGLPGLKAPTPYDDNELVVKADNPNIPVNPDGQFWYFAGGPVLFRITRVNKAEKDCPVTGQHRYYPLRMGYAVIIARNEDNNTILEIVHCE